MGKKSSKRRTRWKALPLSGEDGASGSDDEASTTSSGRGPGLVLRMRDRPCRFTHRDHSREPLVKLESKTFDEEEYTKITTPRQDVLFKKGHFGRKKLESSIEEGVHTTQEGEGEDGPMEQMIITSGFVDKRGHYLVNGTSYEIYDPYTNTITVVVGPPPYTNGVSPPVLAAVSCQPVPLQQVDWYPPGQGDWPPGPAWAPAYPKPPESGEAESPGAPQADEPPLFQQPFLFPFYPIPFSPNGVGEPPVVPEEECETEQESPPVPEQEIGEIQLLPVSDEFVPSSVLKPPATEFVPNSVLKPPTAEFVPQTPNGFVHVPSTTLKPGPVFVPRQNSEPPATLQPQSQPQENTISTQHHQNEPKARKLEPVQPATPNRPKETVDESDKVAPVEAAPTVETEKALQTPNEQSVRSTRESHGTQTLPELDSPKNKAPPPSPRRSYAKTVSNQKPNEILTDVKKDNNETNGKRIIPINGHDDKLTNGKKAFKTKQQSNEPTNGLVTKTVKPAKINGFDQQNGKPKNSFQNGYQKQNNRRRVENVKRPTQLQIPSEEIEKSELVEDMDFRPVENRRNRSGHNGFVRNKYSPQKRSDSVEKVEPREEKIEHKAESDKSSTISELSSPTELSSGQTTPPDTTPESVENHATELNKSVEKLVENLEQKPKKSGKKNKKMVRRVEVKEAKVEEIFEEPPPLPEFLQPPKNDLMDLDLGDALDHALLRSLRQSEPTSKVSLFPTRAPIFPCDLYTRTNLSQMRATKPEEFFASIVETPTEPIRKLEKPIKAPVALRKPINTAYKPSKKPLKEEDESKEEKPETRLGIVDAVKTWLENQEEPKNELSNPIPAPSAEGEQVGCPRVATPAPDLAVLTDAKTSVDKYYSLSVRRMSKTSETSDVSEHDAVDALEYAFPRPPAIAAHNSGFPTKDLACKLQ